MPLTSWSCERGIILSAGLWISAAAALVAPAHATPVLGTATIDYYLETPETLPSPAVSAPTFDSAGRLTSAGSGNPIVLHSGISLVSTATSLNTFTLDPANAPGFVSAAPPALGSPAVSGVSAVNAAPDVNTTVWLAPMSFGDNASTPGLSTVVVNSSQTTVQNTSGFFNSGVALVGLAAIIGVAPGGNIQLGLSMSAQIDNPTLPDQNISMPPIVVAYDGTPDLQPDVLLPQVLAGNTVALFGPAPVIPGFNTLYLYVLSYINSFDVENLGTVRYDVTFTGIADPATFSLIEFPQSLLDSMRPSGPVLFQAFASEVPEPASLLLLAGMLLLFVLARATASDRPQTAPLAGRRRQ